MVSFDFRKFKLCIMFDNCKRCGSTYFECNRCKNNEFYRHEDDEAQMKENLKIIVNGGLLQ